MLIAKDVMTSPVIAVGPDSTVDEVADILLSHGISAVPVIDRGALLGIVSEGDLIRRAEIGTAPQGRSWWIHFFTNNAVRAEGYVKSHSEHVIDVMTQQVATVVESTPVAEIATLLEHNRIKRVPVLRNGQVVGIVSRANLVQALAGWRDNVPSTMPGDAVLRDAVMAGLKKKSWAHTALINVTARLGEVDLSGLVDSRAQRDAIRVAVEVTPGVHAVNDNLVVRPIMASI